MRELPDLARLHERHRGLTPDLCRAYAEAAAVCFSRYHRSPLRLTLTVDEQEGEYQIRWREPTTRQIDAWANAIDRVEMGAYSVALAAVEVAFGLFATARSRELTGADYFIGPPAVAWSSELVNSGFRLEVSGVGRGDAALITERLKQKIAQVQRGGAFDPALACVVGFRSGIIMLQHVE